VCVLTAQFPPSIRPRPIPLQGNTTTPFNRMNRLSLGDVLRQLIEQHSAWCLYESAQFYAERLYYENPGPESVYLLAQCFYKQGKLKQAYILLHGCDLLPARYLFAVVCVALKKFKEAERALLTKPPSSSNNNGNNNNSTSNNNNNSTSIDSNNNNNSNCNSGGNDGVPGGAAGLYLLGYICRVENRRDAAIAYYQASLQVKCP
jgi:anaphase-promoting complex subunit 3